MKAILLASGFATRLRPLTNTFPKALLPVSGKPILNYITDDLFTVINPKDTVLVTNDLYAHHFENWKKDNGYHELTILNTHAKENESRKGAIGDLVFALKKTGWNEDVLVLSTDTLAYFTFKSLLDFYKKHHGFVNIVCDIKDPERIKNKLGMATIDGPRLNTFIEKPTEVTSTLTSVPHYIYPKETLPLLKQYYEEFKTDLPKVDPPGAIIPWLIGTCDTFAYDITPGYYFDVGTVELYKSLKDTFDPSQISGLRV